MSKITGLSFKIKEMAGRIRELREIEGYSIADMAARTGTSEAEYLACENGESDIKNSVDTAKREGIAEGMEIGMAKGRAEGKHEANTETAQRLLAMGLSAEQVAKATQLPLDIIKNLSNS